ncbi:MAG: PAS domain S-box protein [Elainellaceae cyanobacterium]
MVSSVSCWIKKRSRHLPLRVVLVVPFVVQTVLAVSITGWLALRNGETAVNDVAARYRHEITSRIQQKLDTTLATPHRINQANASAIRLGVVDLADPDDLERYFWQQLYRYSEVNLVYAGNQEGGVVGVARLEEGDYRSFSTENFTKGTFSIYKTMRHGQRDYRVSQSEDYDARTRPWYRAAVEQREAAWSEIFPYTDEKILGIAAAKPIYDDTGALLGVLSTDFLLNQLSDFLRKLEIGYSGKTFVIERSGYLVATSADESPFQVIAPGEIQQRRHMQSSDDVLVRGAAANLLDRYPDLRDIQQESDMTIRLDGDRHFLRVTPFQDGRGLDWLIVVVIPEADFMAQIHANTRNTIIMCVAALVVALVSGILTARWVTRPILKLSAASQAIANHSGHANNSGPTTVDIDRQDELGILAQSFNRMAAQVHQSFDALAVRNHELEAGVAERTAHLVEANHKLQTEIEERKRIEEQLRTSEQRYRTLHEGSQDGVNLFDGKTFIDCNTASLKMFGCTTKAQFCGKTPADFSPLHQPDGQLSRSLSAERKAIALRQGTCNFEWVHQRLDGTLFLADVWLTAVEINGQPMLQAMTRDITARKQAEDALFESAKLAALGSDIGVALTRGDSLTDMLDRSAQVLVNNLDIFAARIWTVNEDGTVLDLRGRAGGYQHLDMFQHRIPVGQSRIGWIAQERTPYFTESILSDLRINKQQWNLARVEDSTGAPQDSLSAPLSESGNRHSLEDSLENAPKHSDDSLAAGVRPASHDLLSAQPGAIAFAGYPLVVDDQLVGVLTLLSRQSLSGATRHELFSIANEIALGIKHKRVESALQESEARYRSIVENTSDLIVIFSLDGKFLYASPNYGQVLGYDSEYLIGQSWAVVTHPDETEMLNRFSEQLVQSSKSLSSPEFRIRTQNGQWRWYTAAASCVRDDEGHPLYLVSIARDVSDRIQTEETLRQAKTVAEVANRAKSEFIANVSHELRTPLNGILGYAQTLKRTDLSPKQQEGLQVIQQCGEHLLTLINDILDLSKIEARKMELRPTVFSLSNLLTELVNLFRLRARQKQIQFHYDLKTPLPRLVWGDEQKIRQVLINLLGNAIKFTEQGKVVLRVSSQMSSQIQGDRGDSDEGRTANAWVSSQTEAIARIRHVVSDRSLHQIGIEVEDTGIGIEASVLEEIFQPFQQIGLKEGTGLGLSISKQLLELMGGQLQVNSTPKIGSCFGVELELLEVEAPPASAMGDRPIVGYQGRRRSVLIVDDNAQNRSFLDDILSSLGFQTLSATSGEEGIQKAVEHHPDLVLMDVIMPRIDGLEATRQLRSHEIPEVRDVVIIAASASISDQAQQTSLDAGCNGFLSKPIKIDDLLHQIKRFLQVDWVREDDPVGLPNSSFSQKTLPFLSSSQASLKSSHSSPEQRSLQGPLRPQLVCPRVSLSDWLDDDCFHDDDCHAVAVLPSHAEQIILADLARIGDIQGIMTRLDVLEDADQALKPFVNQLRSLAKTFQIRKIRDLLDASLTRP